MPEISSNGDYFVNKTWEVELLDYGTHAMVKYWKFKPQLVFETYWYPLNNVLEIAQYVQSQANAVGKNQSKSLRLINNVWGNEI